MRYCIGTGFALKCTTFSVNFFHIFINMHDIEKTIEHLKRKNISVAAIYNTLGMERGLFNGRRHSTNPIKREELAKEIRRAFAEHFKDEKPYEDLSQKEYLGNGTEIVTDVYQAKYIQLLEQNAGDLKRENEALRLENKQLLEELKKALKENTGGDNRT